MVTYNQKDARVRVNSQDLFCNSASLKYSTNLSPSLNISSTVSRDYRSSQPPNGSVSMTYFLTGSDPLYTHVENELSPVTINFNGLTVTGYLTSYSFNANPFSDTEITADFNFYQNIEGTYSAQSSSLGTGAPLSVSDMELTNGSLVSGENIVDMSYNYRADIVPSFAVEEDFDSNNIKLHGVTSRAKRVDIKFTLYDYDLSLAVTGQKESFKFNFKNKNGATLQNYYANGFINSKNIQSKVQDRVISDYSMSQVVLGGEAPTITGITASTFATGASVTVSGTNFSNVESVNFGQYPCEVQSNTSTEIQFRIPDYVLDNFKAPLVVNTQGGSATTGTLTCTAGLTRF